MVHHRSKIACGGNSAPRWLSTSLQPCPLYRVNVGWVATFLERKKTFFLLTIDGTRITSIYTVYGVVSGTVLFHSTHVADPLPFQEQYMSAPPVHSQTGTRG